MRKIENYISNLKIKSFKGLEDVEIKDCKKLNILVGENNAGKTTVLEAVRCFYKPWDYMEYINILKRNPYANFSSFSLLPQMFNQRNNSDLVEIIAEIDKKENSLKIKKDLRTIVIEPPEIEVLELLEKFYTKELKKNNLKKENDFIKISSLKNGSKILRLISSYGDAQLFQILYEIIINKRNTTEEKLSRIKNLKRAFLNKKKIQNILELSFSFFNKENKLTFYKDDFNTSQDEKYTEEFLKVRYSNPLDYLLDNYSNEAIDTVIRSGEKNKIIDILKLFEESVFDFNILSDGQIIVNLKNREGEKVSIGISNFGDGMKKALVLISKLIACENGILLIDELETGIHKDVMGKIFNYILKEAEKYNVQLFVATHSLEAIETLLINCEENLENVSVYRLEHYQDSIYTKKFSGERAYDIVIDEGRDLR